MNFAGIFFSFLQSGRSASWKVPLRHNQTKIVLKKKQHQAVRLGKILLFSTGWCSYWHESGEFFCKIQLETCWIWKKLRKEAHCPLRIARCPLRIAHQIYNKSAAIENPKTTSFVNLSGGWLSLHLVVNVVVFLKKQKNYNNWASTGPLLRVPRAQCGNVLHISAVITTKML